MSDELANLYGVGGQVYTFIHQARNDYNQRGQVGMAHRAQELLDLIGEYDKEIERISREVNLARKKTSLPYSSGPPLGHR